MGIKEEPTGRMWLKLVFTQTQDGSGRVQTAASVTLLRRGRCSSGDYAEGQGGTQPATKGRSEATVGPYQLPPGYNELARFSKEDD